MIYGADTSRMSREICTYSIFACRDMSVFMTRLSPLVSSRVSLPCPIVGIPWTGGPRDGRTLGVV
jgi:hypothetical protein